MQNGYCFPTTSGLAEIENHLATCNEHDLNQIRGKLMVGVQSNTEVTVGNSNHKVTQVFCSGLPLSYSAIDSQLWNHFPRLILDAAYESTFYIALDNLNKTGCDSLYLTLVGGGVFGNQLEWILSSIGRSLNLFAGTNLNVKIVSYGSSKSEVIDFLEDQNVL